MSTEDRLEELVARYAEHARIHGEAQLAGDYKSANRNYKYIIRALELLSKNRERLQLVPLLRHSDASVRTWAATHLLPLREELARQTLEIVVKEKIPIISHDASKVLEEWDKGTLTIP